MNIRPVAKVLGTIGLKAPTLRALIADASNYSVLLFQPQGRIDATSQGIRSRDQAFAHAQFGKLLEEAATRQPDLVVTPEYSMPWIVLREAITARNKGPAPGKLWALGCESIKYSELLRLKAEVADVATVVFEELSPDDTKFVDPVTYVFRTTAGVAEGEPKLVVLVQFKTYAMADTHEFEKNLLQLGSDVYQFGNYGAGISLVSLICSDVFGFTDEVAKQVHDRGLIINIQLNREPRHQEFLLYRARLLRFGGDQTEILSLNWASGVEMWINGQCRPWHNVAGSAWYVKPQDFDFADDTLALNHRRGMYYTYFKPHRTHALFFNFNAAAFWLTASKVARPGVPAPVGARRGPQLDVAKTWDAADAKWTPAVPFDDGFGATLIECGGAAAQVRAMFQVCPLACERLLALCAGNDDLHHEWYKPQRLDSFELNQTELIFRMTFCQDTNIQVSDFRSRRLRRCATLWTILNTPAQLPPAIKDISAGFTLEWTPAAPHQNLRSHDGSRATVIYLGEDSDKDRIEQTYRTARERVRTSLDEEAGDRAKQRVALWYRDDNGSLHCRADAPKLDRQRGESELDIGKEL